MSLNFYIKNIKISRNFNYNRTKPKLGIFKEKLIKLKELGKKIKTFIFRLKVLLKSLIIKSDCLLKT